MRSIKSRPRADSFRRPEAVIEPSGKAKAAATLSRRGAFGCTCSGGGKSLRNVVLRFKLRARIWREGFGSRPNYRLAGTTYGILACRRAATKKKTAH